MANKRVFVQAFEATPAIAGRYTGLSCVNLRPGTSDKEGGFYSLVFRATDSSTGQSVAIKIMDPDKLADVYRMSCFVREPQILASLQGHSRCLRLVDGYKAFEVEIPMGAGVFKYPFGFFVTEWLEQSIEEYFYNQATFAALVRLDIFRQIVLAVKALHDQNVQHRDLKRDNLRSRLEDGERTVVAIDLGTAAAASSPALAVGYGAPVGHQGYAPPEAFAGLSGFRGIGHLTDAYALGAMLYELFMPGMFFSETFENPVFRGTLVAAVFKANSEPDLPKRLTLWKKIAREFSRAVQPPSILGPGSSVPTPIRSLLVGLYSRLAAFDLTVRLANLDHVVRQVDRCMRILSNDALQQRVVREQKAKRIERLARAEAKEARVRARAAAITEKTTS